MLQLHKNETTLIYSGVGSRNVLFACASIHPKPHSSTEKLEPG